MRPRRVSELHRIALLVGLRADILIQANSISIPEERSREHTEGSEVTLCTGVVDRQ